MTGKQVIGALAAMALLGACSGASREKDEADAASVAASAPAAPDPSTCPPPEYAYDAEEFGPRTDPLVVPASIATIAATDNTNLAVTTLTGGQMCKDFSWAYNFSNEARSFLDGRLVALGWGAYEAFGTMLFDRAGKGTQLKWANGLRFRPRKCASQPCSSANRDMAGLKALQFGRSRLPASPKSTACPMITGCGSNFPPIRISTLIAGRARDAC